MTWVERSYYSAGMAKGEETRRAILDHALQVATTEGLEGLTIGRLAQDLRLSKSGLFAHFGSKEDLQLQVLETAIERFAEAVVRPALARPRGEPRVRALFENWLDWAEASFLPGGCVFIAAANELDDRPGALRDLLVSSQQQWLAVIARAARIAQEEGHFRADLDAIGVDVRHGALVAGTQNHARVKGHVALQPRADDRRLGHEQRHRLPLHVRPHQRPVRVVVLQKRN